MPPMTRTRRQHIGIGVRVLIRALVCSRRVLVIGGIVAFLGCRSWGSCGGGFGRRARHARRLRRARQRVGRRAPARPPLRSAAGDGILSAQQRARRRRRRAAAPRRRAAADRRLGRPPRQRRAGAATGRHHANHQPPLHSPPPFSPPSSAHVRGRSDRALRLAPPLRRRLLPRLLGRALRDRVRRRRATRSAACWCPRRGTPT